MTPYAAQRIRFGILAARHMLERNRLTAGQVDDLEGMECAGWKIIYSRKAFDREHVRCMERLARTVRATRRRMDARRSGNA